VGAKDEEFPCGGAEPGQDIAVALAVGFKDLLGDTPSGLFESFLQEGRRPVQVLGMRPVPGVEGRHELSHIGLEAAWQFGIGQRPVRVGKGRLQPWLDPRLRRERRTGAMGWILGRKAGDIRRRKTQREEKNSAKQHLHDCSCGGFPFEADLALAHPSIVSGAVRIPAYRSSSSAMIVTRHFLRRALRAECPFGSFRRPPPRRRRVG